MMNDTRNTEISQPLKMESRTYRISFVLGRLEMACP